MNKLGYNNYLVLKNWLKNSRMSGVCCEMKAPMTETTNNWVKINRCLICHRLFIGLCLWPTCSFDGHFADLINAKHSSHLLIHSSRLMLCEKSSFASRWRHIKVSMLLIMWDDDELTVNYKDTSLKYYSPNCSHRCCLGA